MSQQLNPESPISVPQMTSEDRTFHQNEKLKLMEIKEKRILQSIEASKLFLDKWEQLCTQSLYVSVGAFALLPTILNALRSPYNAYSLFWGLIPSGLVATVLMTTSKLRVNGYYRRLSKMMQIGEYEPVRFTSSTYMLIQVGLLGLIVQVGLLITFITINISRSFEEPPRVEAIQASQMIVPPGESITLEAKASDRDQDILSYEWSSSGGQIVEKNQPAATWLSPESLPEDPEEYVVEVVVRDGKESTTRSIRILVRESPEIKAEVNRLCMMVAPLTKGDGPSLKSASSQQQSEGRLFPFQKASFQPRQSVGAQSQLQFEVGPACERIRKFVGDGGSEEGKKARIDMAEKEIQSETDEQKKATANRKRRCCSDAGIPIFCDPTC